MADPSDWRTDGAAGPRRGSPLRHLPAHRRMAAAPARCGGAGKSRARRVGTATTDDVEGRRGRGKERRYLMFGLGNPELGVLMLGLFVVFIMFGFPIAFTLMALGVFFGYIAMGDLVFS